MAQGYITIYSPKHPYSDTQCRVRRSRVIMENHLKRYLTNEETVHHINQNKNDDRIENLRLFKSREEHMGFHGLSNIGKTSKNILRYLKNNRFALGKELRAKFNLSKEALWWQLQKLLKQKTISRVKGKQKRLAYLYFITQRRRDESKD